MSGGHEALQVQQTLYTSSNPTRRWLHCTRRDWIIDALRRHSRTSDGRALEVGFGSSLYLPILAQLYHEAVGIDLEEEFVRNARALEKEHDNLRVIRGDINRSCLREGRFDLVLCTEVVEHIADSSTAIAEMYKVLRPRGTLVLSTPQPLSPLELTAKIAFMPGIISLVRLIYREPVIPTGHINLMSEEKITGQLEAAGFTIRERFKSGVYLPLIAEFLGRPALRLEEWLEKKLLEGFLEPLLWEQYYVAQK
ncbi:MAG TPA: class I SAM-dependent methyltransferase [Terriglobales bacterium]